MLLWIILAVVVVLAVLALTGAGGSPWGYRRRTVSTSDAVPAGWPGGSLIGVVLVVVAIIVVLALLF